MRVIITGAGGFIGGHLVVDQLRRGREVTALDLKVGALASHNSNPKLNIIQGDFTDGEMVGKLLPGHDVCYHLASAHLETGVSDSLFWRVNVEGTRDFIERCYQAGISRFVHCSSVGVFGDIENPPADEDSECHPDVAYEKSKLAGEQAVKEFAREYGFDTVVIRPAWVYGPGCPRTLKLIRQIKKRRFFFVGNGQTLRHPIYIDDMVEGFEVAATHDRASGEVFIMAGPHAVTIKDLSIEIARNLGVPPPRLKLPKAVIWPVCVLFESGGRLMKREAPFTRRSLKFFTGNTAFLIDKANRLIGFTPKVAFPEGVKVTINWARDNRLL